MTTTTMMIATATTATAAWDEINENKALIRTGRQGKLDGRSTRTMRFDHIRSRTRCGICGNCHLFTVLRCCLR
jgi:hypothetical protein